MQEALDVGIDLTPPADTETSPTGEQPVRFVDREQYVQIMKLKKQFLQKQKLEQRLVKKREQRWSQPFADAKIEDVRHILEYAQNTEFLLQMVVELLSEKNIVLVSDIENKKKYHQERLQVFNKLKADDVMAECDKRAEAEKWDIPLNLLGLTEEQVTTENGTNISEITGSS